MCHNSYSTDSDTEIHTKQMTKQWSSCKLSTQGLTCNRNAEYFTSTDLFDSLGLRGSFRHQCRKLSGNIVRNVLSWSSKNTVTSALMHKHLWTFHLLFFCYIIHICSLWNNRLLSVSLLTGGNFIEQLLCFWWQAKEETIIISDHPGDSALVLAVSTHGPWWACAAADGHVHMVGHCSVW